MADNKMDDWRWACEGSPLPPESKDYSDAISARDYVRLRSDGVGPENRSILGNLATLLDDSLHPVHCVSERYGQRVAEIYLYCRAEGYESYIVYVPLIFLVPETVPRPEAAPG